MTAWRSMTVAESSAIRVMLSRSGIDEGRHLRDQLDGALVSHATDWILDIKVWSCMTAVDLPDGPFPARAFVSSRSTYKGEIIVWIANGRLAGLEYAWVTDQPPDRWPEPEEMEVVRQSFGVDS